ncbi:mobilization protein MobL, partial [Psychrobacter sp. 1501(2011)]
MAIFIASTKSISRGKGQSAVASASYRAGEKLEDKRYGKVHDYSKRYGVMSADIILPSSLKDKNITINRGEIWNKAEQAENRKDARVAREWLVNLPYELSEKERKELAHKFSQELADRYGVIADCAIHKPTDKEIERGADPRNFHAHIMLTTRQAKLNDNNEIVLTDKSTAELSDKKRRELGLERMSHEVKQVRQLWESVANEKLAEHGLDLIDSSSYKSQGIDIEPQLKMGSVATKLERRKYAEELKKAKEAEAKGEHYEIDKSPATKLGVINEIINERNELIFNLEIEDNKLINDKAEQIIFAKKQDIEHTTPPPTKAISTDVVKSNAVAQALALAKSVKSKREQEKIAEAKARAEEAMRLQHQREAEQAKQQAIEQAKLEQARAEAERAKQAQAEQRQLEINQFKEAKQEIYVKARSNPDHFKNIEADNPIGQKIIAINVASEAVRKLNTYIDDPTTTDYQKRHAVGERDVLIELTAEQARKALTATKELYGRSDRKTHTNELQGALDNFAKVTNDNVSKEA